MMTYLLRLVIRFIVWPLQRRYRTALSRETARLNERKRRSQ